jgi:hypothetical protein
MTPLQAAVKRYSGLGSRAKAEAEVSSALGIVKPKPGYEERLAKLEEDEKKANLIRDYELVRSIHKQKEYLKEEFGKKGGRRKTRKQRKSKKSRRSTRKA